MRARADAVGVLLATCLLLAGCASSDLQAPGGPTTSPKSGETALSAAAATMTATLRASFPDSYAGLTVDVDHGRLIVYRRPDPALDEAVTRMNVSVPVTLANAQFSLKTMESIARQVMSDAGYWANRGITINGAGPLPDGSGVEVMTAGGAPQEQSVLAQRYGAGMIKIRQETEAVPPIGTTPWRPTPSTSMSPTP